MRRRHRATLPAGSRRRSRPCPNRPAGISANRFPGRPDTVDPDRVRSSSGQEVAVAARLARRHPMRYLLLIYAEEPDPGRPRGARWPKSRPRTTRSPRTSGSAALFEAGEALDADVERDDRPGRGRPDRDDRRSVRRDEGGPRRLLPRQAPRTSTRRSSSPRGSRPRRTARSRSARSGSTAGQTRRARRPRPSAPPAERRPSRSATPGHRPRSRPDAARRSARRRRPRLPRGAGPGGRNADPRPRRLRPRRGGGPGGVRRRPRDVAVARRA